MSDFSDKRENREKLGISRGSVSFGQEHSIHFYNEIMTSLLYGAKPENKVMEREACLEMIERMAIVKIELTHHDVVHINKELRETAASYLAIIGGCH